jgi:hypothetical protein
VGKACEGIQWAPSNRPIDQNSRYTPDCVWIDNPSGDEGAPIHQAFSFHIKDFIGEKGRAAQYRANTESLCNSKPRMHFYEQHKFHEPIAVFQPPLEYNEDGTDKDLTKVIGVEGFIKEQHHEEGLIAKRDNETETPRIPPAKRAQKFRERLARELIYSHHSHHSAREVCEDPSSLSSDIVSHEEGMWCDWTNRRLLPLCSNTDAGGNDCFDEVEHDVRPRIRVRGSKPKKTKRYAKISTWGVAKKR